MKRRSAVGIVIALAAVLGSTMEAQRGAGSAPTPAPTARRAAPFDPTGMWVSFVTEDWRFRMMTPPKGDARGVPLTPEGRKITEAWNPADDRAAGNECKAYGAPTIMRVPGRFRIAWQDDQTLRIESDAGMQTRVLRFGAAAARDRTWQGHSSARWERATPSLVVQTTNLRAGYLRPNGVPYSENATLTEYFTVGPHPHGGMLLMVTSVVRDPRFLQRPYVTSTQFKQEQDAAKWNPQACAVAS